MEIKAVKKGDNPAHTKYKQSRRYYAGKYGSKREDILEYHLSLKENPIYVRKLSCWVSQDGMILSRNKPANGWVRGTKNKAGYRSFHTVYIHRIVANAFIPNPKNKEEVNHKDLNKENNNLYNLEWTTSKENSEHYSNCDVETKRIKRPVIDMGTNIQYISIAKCAKETGAKYGLIHKHCDEKVKKRKYKYGN